MVHSSSKLSVLKLFNLKLIGLRTLATKNKALLIRWYALHNLHLLLHVLHDNSTLNLIILLVASSQKSAHRRAPKRKTKWSGDFVWMS